jgi:hypothetical protein
MLAHHASSAEDRELFAGLSAKWLSVALDREKADFVELQRFEDDGGAAGEDMYAQRLTV